MIIYGSNIFCFLDSEPIQCSLFRPPSIGSFSVCFPTEAHSLSDPSFIGSFLSSLQTDHLQKRKRLSQKKLDSFSQFELEVKNSCFRRPMIYRACELKELPVGPCPVRELSWMASHLKILFREIGICNYQNLLPLGVPVKLC